MDGKRIQAYWSNEMDALLKTYKQFQVLLPSNINQGASHNGEDGRYVENLLKEYLKRFIPKDLEVLTGFILRPEVKTGLDGKVRRNDGDQHSTQLDLIVYDSAYFPIFQRLNDTVIVPPEGVVAILSVKKTLSDNDIKNELVALKNASKLCRTLDFDSNKVRGPYLGLVSMNSKIDKQLEANEEWIFRQIKSVYEDGDQIFDDTVGFIGDLNSWSIFKRRPYKEPKIAEYIYFEHKESEYHLGFQFILTGILSVYYDKSRNFRRRPGFTSFPSGRPHDKMLGSVSVKGER
jgi:hypothetical protein